MAETVQVSDLQELYQFDAGPVTIYNEWATITNREAWCSDTRLPLLRLLFAEPSMELMIRQSYTPDGADDYFWNLSSNTKFNENFNLLDLQGYYACLEHNLRPYDLYLVQTPYITSKIIHNKNRRAVSSVTMHRQEVEVTNSGTSRGHGGWLKGSEVVMMPPRTASDLSYEAGLEWGYYMDTLRAQVLSAVSLAEYVNGRKPRGNVDILLAGDEGETYIYDPWIGEAHAATKPINLRNWAYEVR